MSGHRMLLGPASYSDQTLLSSSSTIIWKKRSRGGEKHKTEMSFFKHIPGLLLQNICRSVNLTIFKTLSNQTVFYFSPQLSSLRLFTKQ